MQLIQDVVTGIKQPMRKPFLILLVNVLILLEWAKLKKTFKATKIPNNTNSHKLNNIGLGT
jgi:hypothetical protein